MLHDEYSKKTLNKNSDWNIHLPDSFFLDEVRESFFIPSMMKRFWAEQLTVLGEVGKICERHQIPWWIADGTLLGAVRHNGFIPWDDDLDIVMLRPDLERFLSIAQAELPENYILLSVLEQPEFTESTNKVSNGQTINDAGDYLRRHHGCPFIAGVDITALDARYRDPEKEQKRSHEILLTMQAIRDCKKGKSGNGFAGQEKRLCEIENRTGRSLRRDSHLLYDLLILRESLCAEAPFEEADELEVFWNMDYRYIYKKAWFEETTTLLFEEISMPAPSAYENVLRAEYGDYNRVVRGGGDHVYPAYCHQEKMLTEKGGHNVQRYTFRQEDMERERPLRRAQRIQEIAGVLDKASKQAASLLESGDASGAKLLLMKCESLTEKLEYLLNHEPEIVFLVIRPWWWGGTIERLWKKSITAGYEKVHVLTVPWSEKDAGGRIGTVHVDTEDYPSDLMPADAESYDFTKNHPDIIYTQYPFDDSHTGMDIPEVFYSSNLLRVTDELVYVPPFEIPDPEPGDIKTLHNLHILIEQPAVVFSDRTIVSSGKMRDIYIEHMCALAGNKTRPLWERKIAAVDTII
ncbi:MAG: LicD family protein [Lachnospiraceae bacterium]|nr:LicD family protein [Lachnospiraceae bacterium]